MVLLGLLLSLAVADAGTENPSVPMHVIIVGESPRADLAVAQAQKLSAQLGLPFGTRGMIVDAKRQLRWPQNFADTLYAGSYFLRRVDSDCSGDNTSPPSSPLGHCLTVERADAYKLPGKGYIIVAGIVGDEDAAGRLPLLRKKLATVRDHVTPIYMGCVH